MSRQTGEERLPAGFARDLKGLRVEAYSPETKRLTFNLVSATNLKTPNDGHVHHATYAFIDNDHFKTSWTFRKDQKDTFTENATYARTN